MRLETGNPEYTPAHAWDETPASLFQPDTLLSVQYFQNLRRTVLEPEIRLMSAILEDALDCFLKHVSSDGEKEQRLFEEAEAWILEEDNPWVFAFENVCEVLGLNPRYLRRGLQRWKEEKQGGNLPLPRLRAKEKWPGTSWQENDAHERSFP